MRKSTKQYKIYVQCNIPARSRKHFCHGKAIMFSVHAVKLNMLLSTTHNHGKCCHEEGTKHSLFTVDPYVAFNNIKLWSHVVATQQWVHLHYYGATNGLSKRFERFKFGIFYVLIVKIRYNFTHK